MATTEEDCPDTLREATEILGSSPTKSEYESLDLTPSSTTILRIVGSWNEAKRRAGLETFDQDDRGGRPIEPKPDEVTLPQENDWNEIAPQQRWYYKNREYRIETKKRRRLELRKWFTEVKESEFSCSECDEGRGPALDFHHVDEKVGGVSQMVNHGYSKERIREEMERCIVLCANCHRIEHYDGPDPSEMEELTNIKRFDGESGGWNETQQRRYWLLANKRDLGGCTRCSVTDPVCVDFHHHGEKTRAVSKMLAAGRPLEAVQREIENCVPLCANCHRVEHHVDIDEGDETLTPQH